MARMRGCLWLTAGLVVAVLAGVVAFLTLSRTTQQAGGGTTTAGPQVSVVVAARAVPVRTQLAAEDVALKDVPVDAAPEGAVPDLAGALGKITTADLYSGEILLSQRLVDPNEISGDGRTALVMAGDQVLMALPAADLMSRVGVLKPGDHVDLLFSLSFPYYTGVQAQPAEGGTGAQGTAAATQGQEEQVTFSLLQNVVIAAVVQATNEQGQTSGAPQALLLTISPQDALTLKYVLDAGGVMDIVLRAPGAEGPFEVEPVDQNYVIDRYKIPSGRR
jgi:pilus assembly protein CpaB